MDYTPDQLHDLMMPNAADDVPYAAEPTHGLYIEKLVNSRFRTRGGPFATEAEALAYLQTRLRNYRNATLRIGPTLYKVRADGLYVMSARRGWQKFEGVQP